MSLGQRAVAEEREHAERHEDRRRDAGSRV